MLAQQHHKQQQHKELQEQEQQQLQQLLDDPVRPSRGSDTWSSILGFASSSGDLRLSTI